MNTPPHFSTSTNAHGFGCRELTACEEQDFAHRKKRALMMLAFLAFALPCTLALLVHGNSAPIERVENTEVDGVFGHYTFLGNRPHGEAWGSNPQNMWHGRYKNGMKHGFFEHSKMDTLVAAGRFYEGKKDGFWRTYNSEGELIVLEHYRKGELIRRQTSEGAASGQI